MSLLSVFKGVEGKFMRPSAVTNAVGYTEFYSQSHDAVIRVYDEAGNVIATDEHSAQFKEVINLRALAGGLSLWLLDELSNVDCRCGDYGCSLGRSLRFR